MKNRATSLPNATQRIEDKDVTALHIEGYDIDNAYPQRINNLVNASATAKSAVGLLATFIFGGGFIDQDFAKTVINSKGHTVDDILTRIADDKAKYRGFAIHVHYNKLYQITEVFYLPFEYERKGKSKEAKYDGKIAVYDNWYPQGLVKKPIRLDEIDFIDRFNPDPQAVALQVAQAGGWDNYKGQVIYFSEDYEAYPLASTDPVIEEMKTEVASSKTTYNNLKNNFSEKTTFTIGSEFETEQERTDYLNSLKVFVGPESDGVLLIEGGLDEKNQVAAPVIGKIPNNLNDKIFEYSDKKIGRKIIRTFNQPAILHSDTDTSALGRDDIEAAAAYYNKITQKHRTALESVFRKIFENFYININPSDDYSIAKYSYFEAKSSILIETIGIGGTQAMHAILADPLLTVKQKRDALMIVFGIDEENANKLTGFKDDSTN